MTGPLESAGKATEFTMSLTGSPRTTMNHRLSQLAASAILLAALPGVRASTNGDNLLGIGTVSRSLGGNGTADPQDALGAISGNPAGLSFLPGDLASDSELTVTFFVPHVSASVGSASAHSRARTYVIPSIGVAGPLGDKGSPWEYGFGIYGLAGLGVNYNNSALSGNLGPTPYPLVAGGYTQFQALEVAPSVAYKVSEQWSLGTSFDLDYGQLSLGGPTKSGLGVGVQPGVVFRPSDEVSLGVSYISAKPITYKGVVDFSGNGTLDNLELEAPQQLAFGAAFKIPSSSLLLVTDARWVNWGDATGYKDFGWQNVWVYGAGLQFDAIPKKLVLRAGYTFGGNPVKTENGFNGTGAPANVTAVQGNYVNNYYYQTFRVVGFPAVVENHVSLGLSYAFDKQSSLELGYTRSFSKTISEQGLNLLGSSTTISSSLSEDSYEVGYRYRF
jgi:long-chain fatty acid transport protein